MVIDMHIHFCVGDEKTYFERLEGLLKYSEENNVVKMGLIGCYGRNEWVAKAFNDYPDRIFGYAMIDLDHEPPETVDRYYEMGFKGLKVILTDKNYDDPSYFPFYEKTELHEMIVLFHTGIIGGPYDYLLEEGSSMVADPKAVLERLKGKSSARMRSIYLDTIANTFPKLKIIGAHLGWPEYMISCAIARWRGNVYFDISGGEVVRRHIVSGGFIGREISLNKLVFGTDSSPEKMPHEISEWRSSLRSMGFSISEIQKVFYDNAARLLEIGVGS